MPDEENPVLRVRYTRRFFAGSEVKFIRLFLMDYQEIGQQMGSSPSNCPLYTMSRVLSTHAASWRC